ncbi:hypothetical protein [Reichenbachiella agariperforans]|uniref:Uncharacterized protein n=1 Tax=Reichenbachiella agariperforans TaxID=156994 RepID=A0A1M6LT56_REIAG|nr:hypothetical protein [Reichenbachiella agariperforans]MBU2914038.1 hypothetical protein [Reichenbachiella agariperforans]SHJ74266.1 hypothetical protein SAMN04488028_1011083 [Reichenbachiella agariperforans]
MRTKNRATNAKTNNPSISHCHFRLLFIFIPNYFKIVEAINRSISSRNSTNQAYTINFDANQQVL